MPPITSTTTSTSSRATSAAASVVSSSPGRARAARARGGGRRCRPARAGAPTRAVRSSACSVQQPDHLASDHAAAQQRDLQGLHIALMRPRRWPAGRPPSRGDDDRLRRRPAPRPPAAAGRGCSCWPSSGSRRRCPARRAGRRGDVAGQELVLDDDVAGLAVLADHAGQHRLGLGAARGERAGVVGVVERGADVVAHPAVDGDVGAHRAAVELDRLDRADLVDRAHRRSDDRPAGLDRQPRNRHVERTALVLDDLGQLGGELCRVGRVVLGGVGDAEAAAEVELGQLTPISLETWACRASTRRAATSKPEVSKICEPMWECRPSSSSPGRRAPGVRRRARRRR